MADNFLPDNYEDNENLNETSNRYMKFETGENKFRVLASAIVGWEWWETTPEGGRTPKRVRIDEKLDVSKLEDPESVKRFWAFPVYNYKLNKIQILEITQKGIQSTLRGLAKSKDWGSPTGYDISVVREGEGLETKYEVIPSPPKPLDKEVEKEFKGMYLNLKTLYEGGDPFAKPEDKITDKDLDEIDES
jgi:hypothetical protein